uniref:DNA-directed DNA polymerase n=1 Tax=Saccoglossus kowalevskii TaxID=10224 RepID=A0ABM0LX65_SACKO
MNGSKVMQLYIRRADIKFIDSLNFLPMTLSKLPKSFGIDELHKGCFPHLILKTAGESYRGPIPKDRYFDPDGMKEEPRKKFYTWYNGEVEKKSVYDLRKELLKYCRSDVRILEECCLAFRSMMMDLTKVDPFNHCITIASVCNIIFRKHFLTPDTIGVVPEKGYLSAQNQSVDAIRWMEYKAHVNNTHIQHVRNSRREMKIGLYYVDGYDASTETYEYYGCYFHGCPKCFPRRNETNRKNELSMTSLYERLLAREEWLKSKGYSLVTMWECNFKNLMKNNHKVE